jgi:hypothetical protein
LNLALIILQVPLIALLIIGAFYHFAQDKQSFDEAARTLYYFGLMKAPLEAANKSINIDVLHRYARTLAKETDEVLKLEFVEKTIRPFFAEKKVSLPRLTTEIHKAFKPISDLAGVRRGSVYFLLVAAGIWFGIISACKEIVTEQPVLRREVRSYLFISPYLVAKTLVLTTLLGIQTGVLTLLVVPFLLHLSLDQTLSIWLILWVAAFASATVGLFISCVVSSYRVALTLVPLLMIPQLLFGGLLRPQVDLIQNEKTAFITQMLSVITIQRWAFEAILTADPYSKGGILKLQVNPRSRTELNLIQAQNISLIKTFFQARQWKGQEGGYLWQPLGYLLGASFIFLLGGYLALRWRFT